MHHIRKSSDPVVQVICPLPVKQNLRSSTSAAAAASSPKINRRRKIDQASADSQDAPECQHQQSERDPLVSFLFQDDGDEGNSEIRRAYLEAEEEFREILGGGLYAHNVMYSLKRRKKGGSLINSNNISNSNSNNVSIKRDKTANLNNNNNNSHPLLSIDLGVSGEGLDLALQMEDYLAVGFPRLGATPSPYDEQLEDSLFSSEEGVFDGDDELEYLRERELSSSSRNHLATSPSAPFVDTADNEYLLYCNFASPPVRVSNPISKNPLFGERPFPVMKTLVPYENEPSSPKGRTGRRRTRINSEPPRKFWELGLDLPGGGNDVECF